jgi:aspartate aminotransferase
MNPVQTPADSAVDRIDRASRRSPAMGAAPSGAISLAMGEPDMGTSPAVVRSAIESLEHGRTRYAPMTGALELRQALALHTAAATGRRTGAEEIVLAHGGSAALASTLLALVNPGERILLPEPTYSLYADQAALIGADVVWIPHLPSGSLDLAAVRREAATARLLILCNPGNPTGNVYSGAQLRAVGEILAENASLLLLSDEAYADITYDGTCFHSALSLPQAREQVIMCGTFSKTYAMTGWRLGYTVAPEPLARRIGLVHRTLNGPLNTFVQDAALTALQTPESELRAAAASYQDRRDLVLERLLAEPRITMRRPTGAFYAFPRIDSSLTSDEMARRFADAGVLVRSGSEFGPSGEGHVRLSFATGPASLAEALDRFVAVVRELP